MAERRSLGEALSLTPDKVDFIKSDKNGAFETPTPQRATPANLSATKADENVMAGRAATEVRLATSRESQPTNFVSQPLVSVTTRLHQDTATALRRAYLEQKLSRRLPDTQQEIIEEALQQWLYERGFLA